jgi:3-dehydroquinate synthase
MAQVLHVNAPDGQYPIYIERGLLARAAEFLPPKRTAIVSNHVVAPLYGIALRDYLPNAWLVTLPDGERYKTLESVSTLYSEFIRGGLDRGGVVVALGGGVIGDSAGFAAATYLRGVTLIQIPTSLLSMVDSSVGGKVGVDLPEGKNLVGAFKQPSAVLIDPDLLATLPVDQWRCGMAEILKHGLLSDPLLLDPVLHTREHAEQMVQRAVQVKIGVVQRDPYERGERAYLNLGHTFGHAIEQVSGYAWSHGQAVAVGLVAAAHLSVAEGLADPSLIELVETLVAETGLPIRIGNLDPAALWAAMATDKKWSDGRSRFVLLKGPQQPVLVEGITQDAVVNILNSMRN